MCTAAQAQILRRRASHRERPDVVNLQKNPAIAAPPVLRNETAAATVPHIDLARHRRRNVPRPFVLRAPNHPARSIIGRATLSWRARFEY